MSAGKPTKKEMSALWSCIQDAREMTRHMQSVGCTPEQIAAAQQTNKAAYRAYIKCRRIVRKATGEVTP